VRPSPTTTEQNAAASAGAERAPGHNPCFATEAEMEILIRACGGTGPDRKGTRTRAPGCDGRDARGSYRQLGVWAQLNEVHESSVAGASSSWRGVQDQ
jgi:hypothetical protein